MGHAADADSHAPELSEPGQPMAGARRKSALSDRPDASPASLAHELRTQSARIARIDGAIAGTPFFLALVPGYLTYLWVEMRMTLRTAALFGHDPRQSANRG